MLLHKLKRANESPHKQGLGLCHFSAQQVLDLSKYSSESEIDSNSFLQEFPLSKDSNSSDQTAFNPHLVCVSHFLNNN